MKRLSLLLVLMLLLAGCDLIPATQPPAEPSTPTGPPPVAETPTDTPPPEASPTTAPAAPTDTLEPPAVVFPVTRIEPAASLIEPVLGQDPGDPLRLAYCTSAAVQLSSDGGETWEALPLDGLAAALAGTEYELRPDLNGPEPACLGVTLDSAHPDSLFLTIETQHREFGAPPIFFMGLYSTDRGQNWSLTSELSLMENFGGFWSNGQGLVQALYGSGGTLQALVLEQTTDGGQTWEPGSLTCPPTGPCLRWGPAPSNIPGMGSPLPQSLLRSEDGETWTPAAGPVELRFPAPKMLGVLEAGEAMLVAGSEPPYLQTSTDGGATWEAVELPPLPGSADQGYPGLHLLPDGAYIAQDADGTWQRWQAMDEWCPLAPRTLPTRPALLRFTAEQVLWLDPDTGAVNSQPLGELQCPMQ